MSSLETPTITQCLGGTFYVPPIFFHLYDFHGLTGESVLVMRRFAVPR